MKETKTKVKKNKPVRKTLTKQLFYNDDQRRLIKLVKGKSFDLFIMLVIITNAIVLGLMTLPTLDFYFKNILFLLDRIFLGIFITEMFLKFFALKRDFFQNRWNIFDLLIVAISSVPSLNVYIVLRTFRLLRLIKYTNNLPYINEITNVLSKIVPLFIGFLSIFCIVFYVFTIIAINLYGDTFMLFGDLESTASTLLQTITLGGWSTSIVQQLTILHPSAWIFFSSFTLITFLITLSFVVAVIKEIIFAKK